MHVSNNISIHDNDSTLSQYSGMTSSIFSSTLDQGETSRPLFFSDHITSATTDTLPAHTKSVLLDFRDQCAILDFDSLAGESFFTNCPTDHDIPFKIKNPRCYTIGSRSNALDDFQTLVENDLKELHQHNICHNKCHKNLSPAEFWAIEELRKNSRLVIRQSDKGGSIVVLNKDFYSMVMSLLQDSITYGSLTRGPTSDFKTVLTKLLDKRLALGVLTKKLHDHLNTQFPVIPIFHGLPKTHKHVFPPPLGPIISVIGSLCEGMSEWVDAHLQPLVLSRPGHLRDSKGVSQAMHNVT